MTTWLILHITTYNTVVLLLLHFCTCVMITLLYFHRLLGHVQAEQSAVSECKYQVPVKRVFSAGVDLQIYIYMNNLNNIFVLARLVKDIEFNVETLSYSYNCTCQQNMTGLKL